MQKKGKAPGPDGVVMEFLKWLDSDNREELLNLFNHWWQTKSVPEELYFARVVSRFKKGETDIAANYRPISLLSSFYKVYRILIRERIQSTTEKLVNNLASGLQRAQHMQFIL